MIDECCVVLRTPQIRGKLLFVSISGMDHTFWSFSYVNLLPGLYFHELYIWCAPGILPCPLILLGPLGSAFPVSGDYLVYIKAKSALAQFTCPSACSYYSHFHVSVGLLTFLPCVVVIHQKTFIAIEACSSKIVIWCNYGYLNLFLTTFCCSSCSFFNCNIVGLLYLLKTRLAKDGLFVY